jgi:hypothetical protein
MGVQSDKTMTLKEKIRANAALAIATLAPLSDLGPQFGYNRESVKWVSGYIERQRSREDLSEDIKEGLIQVLGVFLGECIIRRYGGSWEELGEGLGVFFDEKNAAFPFAKVRKQFDNGAEAGDSIVGFYDIIGFVFKQSAS